MVEKRKTRYDYKANETKTYNNNERRPLLCTVHTQSEGNTKRNIGTLILNITGHIETE